MARMDPGAAQGRGRRVRHGPQLHAGDAAVDRSDRPKVLKGSGECAEQGWLFLGLAIPAWTFVFFIAMIAPSH